MKKLVVLTALLAGLGFTQQASACEWMHQAAQPSTTASCENGNCASEQATPQETATTETAPAAPSQTVTEETTTPASTLVASARH